MAKKINIDTIKGLFILLLFLIPLGEVVRIDLGNNIALKPIDLVVSFIVIAWIIAKPKVKMFPEFFIFMGTLLLSLLFNLKNLQSQQLLVSALYLIRWILYIQILFVVLSFTSKFKKTLILIMSLIGGSIILLGYIQYFYYSNLKNLYYLGWDEHMYRMFSTILDPNYAGAFFVLYFIFILGFLTDYLNKKKFKIALMLSFPLFISLIAVYLTYSRSAILMLFASSITLLVLRKQLKLLIILFIISAIMFAIFSKNFYIENTNLLRIASSEARIDSAKNAIEIIKNNPILGVGFNSYRYAQIRYGFRQQTETINSHADAGTDNSFLFVLATTGIIGFIAYMLFWKRLVRIAFNNRTSTVGIITLSSVAGLFVNSLFINSLFFPLIMLWMWILMGLIENN